MPERGGPNVYSIAAHRGFADALVAGLGPRYSEDDFGLARLTLLLPNRRAARTLTEAFIRARPAEVEGGLLLPRMAVVGDLDLDETLGPLLDPLLEGSDIPPAADPVRRWLRLAEFITEVQGSKAPRGAGLLRLAFEIGRTMDRLLAEGIAPDDLMSDEIIGLVQEYQDHWKESTADFLRVQAHWLADLAARGEVDPPIRRNLLFEGAARRWRADPPPHPIVAAGVTNASPALAGLLRVVSELPGGAVILPDLDLSLGKEVWDALGQAGKPAAPGEPPFGPGDAVTHPQYHLKLLLGRMGVAREEVQAWHRAGLAAAPPARSRAISSLFLPPAASARWASLPDEARRLSGVRLMESAHPGEEALAVALLLREALEVPERRVALVTPDRALAARVVAELARWGIEADDTAGQPLPQTRAGRLFLLLAEVMAEGAPPVPLVALLGHPLVRAGEGRAAWLDEVRRLDLALRGPRPDAGLDSLRSKAGADWWAEVEAVLAPLLEGEGEGLLADWIDRLAAAGEALCGDALWSEADGRSLAAFVEELRQAARAIGTRIERREVAPALREAMERVSVRPPWGGHPRVAIYGLLEGRMARADLVVCAGLHEGSWPGSASTDALLPPAVLRHLGVPGGDFRIGLSAHDLAGALGAPEVVLSWARRDAAGPVIPSRFVLRVQAMMGKTLAARHTEHAAVDLARRLDHADAAEPYPRPEPRPSAEQRLVDISATGLDRLRSDPYQFYASSILGLKRIEPLDAEPSPAWRGTAVHEILDTWHRAGAVPGTLAQTAEVVLDRMSAHPLMQRLWRPRLVRALDWIDRRIVDLAAEGRVPVATECWGSILVEGVRVHARADRIDRLADGSLAIVDYKTGKPPSAKMVKEGYSLQLGIIGVIAEHGAFEGVRGEASKFEYWSLAKDKDSFGMVKSPVKDGNNKASLAPEDFLPLTWNFLTEAIEKWILGDAAFTARLNPDIGGYNDFDQLMRLDEWQSRARREQAE